MGTLTPLSARIEKAEYDLRLATARLLLWQRRSRWSRVASCLTGLSRWLSILALRRELAQLREEAEVRQVAFELPRDAFTPSNMEL